MQISGFHTIMVNLLFYVRFIGLGFQYIRQDGNPLTAFYTPPLFYIHTTYNGLQIPNGEHQGELKDISNSKQQFKSIIW
jgi:hypothetical protein